MQDWCTHKELWGLRKSRNRFSEGEVEDIMGKCLSAKQKRI